MFSDSYFKMRHLIYISVVVLNLMRRHLIYISVVLLNLIWHILEWRNRNSSLRVESTVLLQFNVSGISSFMKVYQSASQLRSRRLVLVCDTSYHVCGGMSDRIQGIPYAISLAVLTQRQFLLHPSILTNEPIGYDTYRKEEHYIFVDGDCDRPDLIKKLMKTSSDEVFVTSNCWRPTPKDILQVGMLHEPSFHIIQEDCKILHRCGAAIIHTSEYFKQNLEKAQVQAANLAMLSLRNYTALHIRAGASKIIVENSRVAAIPWSDGHEDDLSQSWINLFGERPFRRCTNAVAIISDSQRLLSELRLAASDDILLVHCCSQPLHRDRFIEERFPFQEIVDLYVLARSGHIIATKGGFGILGRHWLGGPGPRLTFARSDEEMEIAKKEIIIEARCELHTV